MTRNSHSTEERPAFKRLEAQETRACQADWAYCCGDMGSWRGNGAVGDQGLCRKVRNTHTPHFRQHYFGTHWILQKHIAYHLFAWCCRVEREKSQGIDPSKSSNTLRTAEDVKAHLENQLKQARLAAQQVGTLHCIGFSGVRKPCWGLNVTKLNVLKMFQRLFLETAWAAETKPNRPHFHSYNHHHLSQHSHYPNVHRPEDGSDHIRNKDGPGHQTGLSGLLPARQELPPVVCFLGQAGSEQQQLR